MAYNEVVYKVLLKIFYDQTNKKNYKLQNLQYNIYYINIFAV